MITDNLHTTMEDHALEQVPQQDRKGWLKITWNTAGIITTLVMLFLGALVCFVAGVKVALLAGLSSFVIGSGLGWAIARIAYKTGYSNTLITRRYGLGVRGSALASIIFGFMIIGFLALENGLIYRGFLFFFGLDDDWGNRLVIYGGMTAVWILLTLFGFELVARVSSMMLIAFLIVIVWVVADIVSQSGLTYSEVLLFPSQFPPAALEQMKLYSDWDKYLFSVNILLAPACTLALNTADFGRYGKSTAHIGTAATIGVFFQSLVMMLIGGMLMYAGSAAMVEYYMEVGGMSSADAQQHVLRNPDSIAATFIVFGGVTGFMLMMLAQAKAQVLNTYSSSLCISNFFDALFHWRPGRVLFVLLANIIALLMLSGHILELVEAWLKLLGALVGSLAGVIIVDYYIVAARLKTDLEAESTDAECVNWAGVITVLAAAFLAHVLLKPYIPIEVLSALLCVLLIYPPLRTLLLRP